jgi:hypothetical protein
MECLQDGTGLTIEVLAGDEEDRLLHGIRG